MPDMMYRLGQQGGDQVQAAIRSIGDEGEAVEARLTQAAARKAAQVEQIETRLAQAQAEQQKIRERQEGFTAGGAGGLADIELRQRQEREGAQMAREYTAELDRQRASAVQLVAAIDPLFAAQMRYGQQVGQIEALKSAGVLSEANYQRLMLNERTVLDQASDAQLRHGAGAHGSSIAQMELMHVVRGSSDAFAAGMPPMMIFTQHLGMLAQAASYGGEEMGAFGRFMGGGWGLALTVGVTLLGTLIAGHYSAAAASHDHETAEQTLIRALNGEEDAIRKVTDAMVARRDEAARSLETDTQRVAMTIAQANADIRAASAVRQHLIANLQQERASLGFTTVTGGTSAAMIEDSGRRQRIEQLDADIAEQTHRLDVANATVADTMIGLANTLSTGQGRLDHEFGQRHDALVAQTRLDLAMPGVTREDRTILIQNLQRSEAALDQERRRATQALGDAEAAERRRNSTLETGRHITSAQAIAMVQAAGGHVTSAGRPTWIREEVPGGPQSQERLYNAYRAGHGNLAARPGTGNHEYRNGSNALDITGMSLGQVRELFRSNGVHLSELINEGDHVHAAFGGRGRAPGEAHAETLARENAARVVNTAGLLAEADAYLRSSAAGATSAAQREGLTAATRQGTDTDARARQQLEQNIAQAAVTGAQHVAQLRDETGARQSVNAQVAAGTVAAGDMQRAMQDDAALRPLLVLQAQAHGNALEVLTRVITAYRAALHDAHSEEARADFLGQMGRLGAANDNMRTLLGFQGNDRDRAVYQASLTAGQEARDRHYNPGQAVAFAFASAQGEQLKQAQQAADQFRQMNAAEDDHTALLQYQLGLGRMGEQQRADALAIEQRRLELERQFGHANEVEIQKLLDKARAEQALQHQVERVADAQRELNQFGGTAIDDIFNVQNWNDWGQAGLRVLQMIEQEFITLALANPLKNMLLGEHNSTLSSVFGALVKIGGAVAGGSGGGTGLAHELGHFATGTASAPGGLALVGELGPEIMNVPRGASITPAAQTRRLLAANDGGMGSVSIHIGIDATGADAAGLARVQAEIADLKATLPGRVMSAMAEAKQRNAWK